MKQIICHQLILSKIRMGIINANLIVGYIKIKKIPLRIDPEILCYSWEFSRCIRGQRTCGDDILVKIKHKVAQKSFVLGSLTSICFSFITII